MHPEFVNFGNNVRFTPKAYYEPRSEAEVLEILERHRAGRIRVIASRHAWSELISTDDALISMEHIDDVRIEQDDLGFHAVVGAGCQVKHLLAKLNEHSLTLPSVGLITEQTIAGATATGTHGSGRHSLSHYLIGVRIAHYDENGDPVVENVDEGDQLRAARCSLGCLGVVVAVTLPCVQQYRVEEKSTPCETVEAALLLEADSPRQQFFLFPHLWTYYVQQRQVSSRTRNSWSSLLYRVYWFLCIDVGMCVLVKLSAAWFRNRWMVRLLFRRLLPMAIFPGWRIVDRSDRMLIMEHELFRHLELEAFVPDTVVADAAHFVEVVLKRADGADIKLVDEWRSPLREAGLLDDFQALRGRFTHHYPVCFRRVLRDDTLISMASGDREAWYSISLVTYVEPRDSFYEMASFLAKSMCVLFKARIHWGKWFPLEASDVEAVYPRLDVFRAIASSFDPNGVFQNRFTERVVGTQIADAGK